MNVYLCICVCSLCFSLAFFSFLFVCLLCPILDFLFDCFLFSNKTKKVWILVGGEVGMTWKELGKGNHDLNVLYEKKYFQLKKREKSK